MEYASFKYEVKSDEEIKNFLESRIQRKTVLNSNLENHRKYEKLLQRQSEMKREYEVLLRQQQKEDMELEKVQVSTEKVISQMADTYRETSQRQKTSPSLRGMDDSFKYETQSDADVKSFLENRKQKKTFLQNKQKWDDLLQEQRESEDKPRMIPAWQYAERQSEFESESELESEGSSVSQSDSWKTKVNRGTVCPWKEHEETKLPLNPRNSVRDMVQNMEMTHYSLEHRKSVLSQFERLRVDPVEVEKYLSGKYKKRTFNMLHETYDSMHEVLTKKLQIKLTEKEVRRLWSEVDVAKRGAVELEEFAEWCTRMGIDKYCDIEQVFDAADQRDFGLLDFGEFRCCLLGQSLIQLSRRELMTKFKQFDTDKNGVLEYPEFEKACIELEFATHEDLHHFFESVDEDQNGVISFQEFAKAILGETTDIWQ